MLGCAPRVAQRELALESRFDAALDRNDIRNRIQRMSSAPNGVGSPHDKANAEWMLKQFRTWGLDAHIAKCEVLFPVSEARGLALVAPTRGQAQLREPPVPALDFRPLDRVVARALGHYRVRLQRATQVLDAAGREAHAAPHAM